MCAHIWMMPMIQGESAWNSAKEIPPNSLIRVMLLLPLLMVMESAAAAAAYRLGLQKVSS